MKLILKRLNKITCVNKLIKIYPNIKYIQSNLDNDSSLLFNYNLLRGRLYGNKLLKNLWTYNRILKFHNKRYTNYYMEPSKEYEK